MDILDFCTEECRRQGSGKESIPWMISAWELAQKRYFQWGIDGLIPDFIEAVGNLVEPVKNAKGFRKVPIFVGPDEKLRYPFIPDALEALLGAWRDGTYQQFALEKMERRGWEDREPADLLYLEFEDIHPFVDGNGRTGKILLNYVLGILDNPRWPYNWWGTSNP